MPRASRAKAVRHAAAVRLPIKLTDTENDHGILGLPLPESSAPAVVASESSTSHGRRRMLPLPDITSPSHPYSRSHLRREKRKAKQQLHGGEMHAVTAALSVAFGEEPPSLPTSRHSRQEARRATEEKRHEEAKISEGKGRTLSEKVRRAQIKLESKRIPAVMKHPEFQTNPWAAIRMHAGNSVAVVDQASRV